MCSVVSHSKFLQDDGSEIDFGVGDVAPDSDEGLLLGEHTSDDAASVKSEAGDAELPALDPPPLPPPLDEPPQLDQPGPAAPPTDRDPDEFWVNLQVASGKITWYKSKNAYEATCKQPGHGRCVLTSSAVGGAMYGRPVGLLMAFMQHKCASQEAHKRYADDLKSSAGRQARLDGRAAVKLLDMGRRLLAKERPQFCDEPEEPIL